MIEKIDKLSSFTGRLVIDGFVAGAAFYLAYLARYEGKVPPFEHRQWLVWLAPIIIGNLAVQTVFGLHKHKWRYVGTYDVVQVLEAYAAFSFALLALRLLLPLTQPYDLYRLPISVIAIQFMISLLGAVAVRYLRRLIHQRAGGKEEGDSLRRILLVGAGRHGITVANEMLLSRGVQVVGFVDDDPHKIGAMISGLPVLGPVSSLTEVVGKHKVDEVLICVPPTGQKKLSMELPKELSAMARIVPTLDEILFARGESAGTSQKRSRVQGDPSSQRWSRPQTASAKFDPRQDDSHHWRSRVYWFQPGGKAGR